MANVRRRSKQLTAAQIDILPRLLADYKGRPLTLTANDASVLSRHYRKSYFYCTALNLESPLWIHSLAVGPSEPQPPSLTTLRRALRADDPATLESLLRVHLMLQRIAASDESFRAKIPEGFPAHSITACLYHIQPKTLQQFRMKAGLSLRDWAMEVHGNDPVRDRHITERFGSYMIDQLRERRIGLLEHLEMNDGYAISRGLADRIYATLARVCSEVPDFDMLFTYGAVQTAGRGGCSLRTLPVTGGYS